MKDCIAIVCRHLDKVKHFWSQPSYAKRYNLPMLAKSWQLQNMPVDCTRELFKPSKDSASLLVCNEKFLGFGFEFFCGSHHKWDRFLAIVAHVTWPWT